MTRIYLPATLPLLRELRDTGKLTASRAHAVTPGLREWYTEGDEEDLEYAAFTRAAQDSLPLLHADGTAESRRVVVSADVEDSAIVVTGPELGGSAVNLNLVIPLSSVASVHIDGDEAEVDVSAARHALPAADNGDPDAQFIVDSAEDHELQWYDPSELSQLL